MCREKKGAKEPFVIMALACGCTLSSWAVNLSVVVKGCLRENLLVLLDWCPMILKLTKWHIKTCTSRNRRCGLTSSFVMWFICVFRIWILVVERVYFKIEKMWLLTHSPLVNPSNVQTFLCNSIGRRDTWQTLNIFCITILGAKTPGNAMILGVEMPRGARHFYRGIFDEKRLATAKCFFVGILDVEMPSGH